MPASLAEPVSLGPTARTPLEDAINAAAAREVELPTLAASPPLSDALRLSASRMYAQARAALLAGDQSEAADLFGRVVAIDPTAGQAWSSLAMISAAQGDLPAAAEAWQSALAADPTNTRALEQLGLAALRSSDLSKAITLLSRARLNDPERVDAALPYLLDAALADAFEQSGAVLAAAQAAERAASAPAPFDSPTNEQRRLLSLLRQRAFLLRGAGDMLLRLGDLQGATDAYLAALDLDDTLDAPTLARAIYTQRQLSADASAAATLVRELERSSGRVNALHIRLVEHLSETLPPAIAAAFAESLPGIAARGDWDDTPAARSAAARLDAAGQPTAERSAEVLLAYLTGDVADDAATEQLARTARATPATLASGLARLTASNPLRAPYFAQLFLRSAASPQALDAALSALAERSESAPAGDELTVAQGAALARAWFALRNDQPERALESFDALTKTKTLSSYAELGRIESLYALGRMRDATNEADALARSEDPVTRLLAAEANSRLQRHDEAFQLLRPLTQAGVLPERDRGETLLLAARSAAAIGQTDIAARWLQEATMLAPLREDAYAGLLQIAFAAGNQRNQAQLADVVRRLRENIPTSRTLRLLQARELAGQNQPLAALEILTDLLALDPRDESAQEQYIATLIAAGRAANAESWLRDRLQTGYAQPTTVVLLARVLVASGRSEEAEQLLSENTDRFPRSDALLRERENLLRGTLNQPLAADELALERLTMAPPTLDNTIELAEVQARLSRWADAGASLERALSQAGVSLRRDQRERVARAIGFFAAAANEIDEPTARFAADAAGLLVEEPGGAASDALHRSRIVLLVRAGAPVSELLSASEAPARANRDLALQLRLGAAEMMKDSGQVDQTFELLRSGASLNGAVAPEILTARVLIAAEFDRPEESIAAIEASINSNTVAECYTALNRMLFGEESGEFPTADALAYLAAQVFGSRGLDESANDLYEYILSLNPNHPWAANNLGYGLAESGADVLRAYDLLLRAYAQLPSETAIIDSIGWVRYRVGIFDDTVNAHGQKVEGAITLLRRAATMGGDPLDYVMHEHLGDALWRAGQTDEAVRAWRRADQLALTAIQRLESLPEQSPEITAFGDTLRTARQNLNARIAAAGTPGVEPDLPEVFLELREPALNIPNPDLRPALPGAPGA